MKYADVQGRCEARIAETESEIDASAERLLELLSRNIAPKDIAAERRYMDERLRALEVERRVLAVIPAAEARHEREQARYSAEDAKLQPARDAEAARQSFLRKLRNLQKETEAALVDGELFLELGQPNNVEPYLPALWAVIAVDALSLTSVRDDNDHTILMFTGHQQKVASFLTRYRNSAQRKAG